MNKIRVATMVVLQQGKPNRHILYSKGADVDLNRFYCTTSATAFGRQVSRLAYPTQCSNLVTIATECVQSQCNICNKSCIFVYIIGKIITLNINIYIY